jgi:L-lactate dehydrogenase (cytochrome)
VVKALCLGAKGVGMGRPFMYALTYGEDGVAHAIESEWALLESSWV